MKNGSNSKRLRLLEFFAVGVLVGLAEDLLAIFFATDAEITWHVVLVVLLVAVPFAFVSEFVVDHPRFWKVLLPKNLYRLLKNSL